MEQGQTPSEKPGNPPAQASLHELRTAENSAAYSLPKLQSMKQTNPHLKLLDVGAGSGTISASFAKLIPNGHVTGIDVNPNILPRARAVAEAAGIENIEFQEGSVYKLPFADETFDITVCHQVLIHIGTPWEALREMLRVTKRGGIVGVREGDYEMECVWPENSELSKFHELMAGLMRAGGGTPIAGRELVSWALKVGVEPSQIVLSYSTLSYSMPSERKACAQGLCDQLRGGGLRAKALKFDLGTQDEFEDMAKAWKDWMKRDDASLVLLQTEILIEK
ncbi:S-adenosyl-L-methionine-dependent methyltransferase [Tothia fuscella]|uniref:S-adenosyl-L-methionine-dependent methyltransferase n=1 Tax=Tothia fuscella TaxID=1048955 RepID=A0A9P4NK47_9PEZI|nr:S-adenosyl-L-methionine-dependent methyltransferase [Tothia fuscella]